MSAPETGKKIFNLSRVEIFHSTGFGLLYAAITGFAIAAGGTGGFAAVVAGATPWLIGAGLLLGALCIANAIRIKRKQDALDKQEEEREKSLPKHLAPVRTPQQQLEPEATRAAGQDTRFTEKYLQETSSQGKAAGI